MTAHKLFANQLDKELKDFLLQNKDAPALVTALNLLLDTLPQPDSYDFDDTGKGNLYPEPSPNPDIFASLCNNKELSTAHSIQELITGDHKPSLETVQRLKLFFLLRNTLPDPKCLQTGNINSQKKLSQENFPGTELFYNITEFNNWCKTIVAICNNYEVLTTGFWVPVYAAGWVLGYLRIIHNETNVLGETAMNNIALVIVNSGPATSFSVPLDKYIPSQSHDQFLLDALDNYAEIPIEEEGVTLSIGSLESRIFLWDRWARPTVSNRKAGILLHPTSLPSNYGVGDLGVGAMDFIDFLEAAGQKLWQVLPINPPGYGNSPYQCFSAFAGNSLLIDIDNLVEQGLLPEIPPQSTQIFPENRVDFEAASYEKTKLFKEAFSRFNNQQANKKFDAFCRSNSSWLEEYSLFMALKSYHEDAPWPEWEPGAAHRKPETLSYYRNLLQEDIEYHKFLQYQFWQQWLSLKRYANSKGISLVGDIPIYAAHDSSDVWSNRDEFYLDEKGNPVKVAGVPPDAFTRTGQLWGNPIYRWDIMEQTDFRWWKERLRHLSRLVDVIRIDHFRGFEAYWEVPAEEDTAINGRWIKGPGEKLFKAVSPAYGTTKIIAEDLGFITPEVEELRNSLGFPGMSILQFDIREGKFAVPLDKKNTVAYTGTHDNETILGWFKNHPEQWDYIESIKEHLEWTPASGEHDDKHWEDCNCNQNNGSCNNNKGNSSCTQDNNYYETETDADDIEINISTKICRHFVEMAMDSDADTVIIPLQDILCLDNRARMNTPGTATGNWEWRISSEALDAELEKTLKSITLKYRR